MYISNSRQSSYSGQHNAGEQHLLPHLSAMRRRANARAVALPAPQPVLRWQWKNSLIAIGVIAAALFAVAPAKATALDEFRQFVTTTHSAKGTFSQQTTSESADPKKPAGVKISSGTFIFSRPGKFIWTYEKPYHQLLQSDGQKLYIFDSDLNQVTTRKLDGALGSSPAAILFGSNDLERNFTLKDDGNADGLAWLSAVPKGQDMSFKKIRIGLKNGIPQKMELQDTFGKTSILTLSGIVNNPPLSPTQFQFTVPAGADVYQN